MWGGEIEREYLYIDDAVEAYLRLLSVPWVRVGRPRVFNIGTEQSISIQEMIEKILAIRGVSLPIRRVADERQDEIPSQRVSTARARDILDWAPRVSLDEGLRTTIAWYAMNRAHTALAHAPDGSERVLSVMEGASDAPSERVA